MHLTFILYGFTISLTEMLMASVESQVNLPFYLIVFKEFHPVISQLSLLVMMLTSVVQAIINYHIALEQICILVDELNHRSMTKNVERSKKTMFSMSTYQDFKYPSNNQRGGGVRY